MPCQWRTIAPIIGRTPAQSLEHYEMLLRVSRNTALVHVQSTQYLHAVCGIPSLLLVHLGRGGVAGPAGPALAGPLFSGSLVPCPDCRDGLRTRRLGQVSHASSPLPCVYAFLVIVPALLPADQEPGAARPDCISTHVLPNTHAYTTCSC